MQWELSSVKRGKTTGGVGWGRHIESWVKLGPVKFVELLESQPDTCRIKVSGVEGRGLKLEMFEASEFG